MKLIIDIPEERYKEIKEEQWLPNRLSIEKAIANGTPIPEDTVIFKCPSYATNKSIITQFVDKDDGFFIEEDIVNNTVTIELSLDFWKSLYQKGGKVE